MPKQLEEPLKPEQAALLLGMGVSSIYKMLKRGDIEGFYVGEHKGGVRIDRSEIQKYKKKYSTKFKLKNWSN